MKICQNVQCSNIGVKVKCVIECEGKDSIHEIFLCRFCIKKQEDLQPPSNNI
jgi:hypothetical protein